MCNNNEINRWAIYIDVEGFGSIYPKNNSALCSLIELAIGIYQIASRKYPDSGKRLFAHQLGDAFVIVSDFHEESLDRAIAITITLMRHVLNKGGVSKAAISEGGFEDIKGCYPDELINEEKDGKVAIGNGIMTLNPIMGSALINAVSVEKRTPSGALLTLESKNKDRFSNQFIYREIENNLISINWLKGKQKIVKAISSAANLENSTEEKRIEKLKNDIKNH